MLVYARISGLKKYRFLSRFLGCQQAPQALTPVNARVGLLARLLLFFTVTIMLLQIFTRHGELRLDVAFEFGLMGASVRSAIVLSGSLAMIGSVLPRWQCNIERISPERTEGYCHSGGAGEQIEGYCHSGSAISRGCRWNVRGSSSLGELISNKAQKKKKSCKHDPARQLTRLARAYIYSKY